MKKIIIIKYGELSTKKDNINFFLKVLKQNVEKSLIGFDFEIKYDHGRMFINCADSDIEKIQQKLTYIFGIHEIVIGNAFNDTSLANIKKEVLKLVLDARFKTFKVNTKRSDKNYPILSTDISKEVGGYILENIENITVDVHNPDETIEIEIRKTEAFVYFKGIKGLGGYPVSTLGKGLLMLSGGIDSPVAGYLAIKRGIKIEALYFESPPHTSLAAKEKVKDLAKELAKYNMNINIHVINFTKIQEEILKNIPHEYLITIMRRMMYRISEEIARYHNCKILINGESIGQVASQTLTSMNAINSVVTMPVIRPVACFDKLEIISVAKKIGTYDISIRPFEDCCTIFVPDHPVINPDIKKCIEYEKLIPYENYIKEAIKGHEIIKININEKKFENLL